VNAPTGGPSFESGFYNFLFVLFKRKWTVLVTFVVTLGTILFGTYLERPLYDATTKVWIHKNPKQSIRFFGDIEIPQMPINLYAPTSNIVEVAVSKEIAVKMVKENGLDERRRKFKEEPTEFRDVFMYWYKAVLKAPIKAVKWVLIEVGLLKPSERAWFAEAVDEFEHDILDISSVGVETEVMSVGVWLDDPELAAKIANAITEEVITRLRKIDTREADISFEFARDQVVNSERKLREGEAAVSEFKRQTNVLSLDDEKRIKLDQFAKLEADSTEILSNLALYGEKRKQAEEDLKSQQARFGSLELYRDVEKKALEYRQTEASLRAKMQVLEHEIERQKGELAYLNEVEFELARLERDVAIRQTIYNNLRSKVEELDIQRVKQLPEYDLQIIDRAQIQPGADPDWPDWTINTIVALVVSLALALGLPFLLEFWDDTLRNAREVEDRIELPVLASIRDY